ncbi:MAG TPA: CHAD domain-containing protein [Oscillatoriaceae cyanobacterium M33_DOE_052]|uniref:CHAD domain-containing protein n=1 Tax=Planktothricoides sp. SpSt-374 TaxID=2282167 RepID=A0A7C3ZJV0_9CYAN|nr:CHAD domain-containing protein [Oscillatoriaceae cyanobacterium M33_DOE_052]
MEIISRETNPLGHWAHLAIEKHFQKTIKYEEEVLQDEDPEALHQMRVGMRRLRSAASGFAPALILPESASVAAIGKIARTLGKLRDLDVMLALITNQTKTDLSSSEKKQIKEVITELKHQRALAFQEVKKTLHTKKYKNFKKHLKYWLENPEFDQIATIPISQVLPDLLLPEVSQMFLHPGWLVGVQYVDEEITGIANLEPSEVEQELAINGEILHDLRKQVKRVRYQMSLFADLYGPDYTRYLGEMKAIQEILGQIQDSQVLAGAIAAVLGAEIAEVLPVMAAKLASNIYESWQEWQTWHEKYFAPETRRDFRLVLLSHLDRE